ncbi:hypothetical protein [uncultured Photobacterium sp.]|uniref:hypothetical protein n=1 Tax=uncultured Photobacterium sp. TaxID=173973 RepID=UPI002635810D|nr:hypothetical protein [uncultured Photobacterium sp.]
MKYFMFFLLLSVSSVANATNLYCAGKIKNVYIDQEGSVNIKGEWHNSWTRICNTKGEDTVTCSLWASYAATAVKNNLNVTVHYQVEDGSTCASLPTYYKAPKPHYFMIHNPGL